MLTILLDAPPQTPGAASPIGTVAGVIGILCLIGVLVFRHKRNVSSLIAIVILAVLLGFGVLTSALGGLLLAVGLLDLALPIWLIIEIVEWRRFAKWQNQTHALLQAQSGEGPSAPPPSGQAGQGSHV